MDTRIKHSQTFTDYLAVRTHDFESIQNTEIGASFGDDYFKHLIVTGVKGDIRFQGELEQLEREGANMARIVMRLAKVGKEGKLEHNIRADTTREAARAMSAVSLDAEPALVELSQVRAQLGSLERLVKGLEKGSQNHVTAAAVVAGGQSPKQGDARARLHSVPEF
jgi:hypothetical protein